MANDPFTRAIADADRLLTMAQIQKEMDALRESIRAGREAIGAEHVRQAAKQPDAATASVAYAINRPKDPRL